MDKEIVDYILLAQKHGLLDQEIKQNLLNAGWDANTVEQNFIFSKAAETHTGAGAPPPQPAAVNNFPKPEASQPAAVLQSTRAAVVISEQNFQKNPEPKKPKNLKKLAIWAAVIILLLLACGAYAYYSLVLANPVKIWQKFTQGGLQTAYQTKFDFSYSDPGEAQSASNSPISYQLKDIKLNLSGSGYVNARQADNPESSSTIQYTFSSGNTSFSTGLQYILQNKILYLNVGNNPILDFISQETNGGQKIDWIKIDLNQLENAASGSPDQAEFYQQLASPDFKNQLQKIWQNTTIIKEDSYVGREKISGVTTLHFKNSIDKQALKNLVSQYIQQLAKVLNNTNSQMSDSDVATINQITSQIIDKIQISDFETWVGMTDFKLYQVKLVVNAPSFISLVKNASTFSAASSNDDKRISDVREMASALELYYNDHKGYPDGNKGQPIGLAPTYIGLIPTAPPTNGNCSDFYNTYWYQPTGTKSLSNGTAVYSSYQMTFCLGSSTGGYDAGIGKLTPSGISANIACPGDPQHCVKSADAVDSNLALEQQITNFLGKLNFSANIQADATYSDYGKTVTITPPTGSFDILQKYQETQSMAGDAKRIADVSQMASALELYFNDNNSYPDSLNALAPKYIGVVPVPPAASGTCSEQDNAYTYVKIAPTNYQLTFCLGQATGAYQAGKHTLTPTGIQ
jgi:hypothetical protein